MTREEAIKAWDEWRKNGYSHSAMPNSMALVMAYNALRGPTREQVEKVWRSEWDYPACEWNLPKCPKCGCNSKDATYGHKNNFCPRCGASMTDEAIDITLRRLEALYGKP